jgi:hypothetical protein
MKNLIIQLLLNTLILCSLFSQAPDTLWLKIYPGSITGYDEALLPTLDSGYAIATTRYTWGAANKAIYLIKTNKYGDTA